ncbi:MAG: SDR family oxidoreductase [Chthoniobacterales bacterium]
MKHLLDKVIVITGAGSGIGKAFAIRYAAEGAKVVLTGRRESRLKEVADLITANGGHAFAKQLDVTDKDTVEAFFNWIKREFGQIDILINNAGSFQCLGALWEIDPEEWWTDATINLRGPMLTMHYALQLMMEKNSGLIINMNGGGSTVPLPGGSGYGSSKAGLLRLTEGVAEELKSIGSKIIVLAMGPGLVRTEMTELQAHSELGRKWIPSTKEYLESGEDATPEGSVNSILDLIKNLDPAFAGRVFVKGMNFAQLKSDLPNDAHKEAYKLRLIRKNP